MFVSVPLIRTLMAGAVLSALAAAQGGISFPSQDGGLVYADLYGKGDRGLVLAHGGRFNKESWEKQARVFAASGFRVLAIDFAATVTRQARGSPTIVLAAVRYLRACPA